MAGGVGVDLGGGVHALSRIEQIAAAATAPMHAAIYDSADGRIGPPPCPAVVRGFARRPRYALAQCRASSLRHGYSTKYVIGTL